MMAPWADQGDAAIQMQGVQLIAREGNRVTLQAHIDSAAGDSQRLALTGVTLTTPDGAVITTQAATWDGSAQTIEATTQVQVRQASGTLTAPGGTFHAPSGHIELRGPVRGAASQP